MQVISLLLPDFILILMGVIIFRITDWGGAFWAGMEKMVYYLLFPALLFYSTARLQLNLATTGKFVQVGVLALLSGVALTWIGKPFIKAGPMTYESGMQTAFRFNSYIALALASRLAGEKGVGLMALLIGFGVPLCNMAAVHALAHRSGNLFSELARNPLLIATGSGLLFALCGFTLPEVASAVLSRLGSASIALGLLMVGAGLRLAGIREDKLMTTYFTAIKLLAVPAVAYVLGRWFELPTLQLQIVVLFCSLPTASSCYILAARMGGNGPMTAFLISLGTLVSAVTIPFWLMLVH